MPVYSNLEGEYSDLGLGARIRELRKAKGWTLDDLSSRLSLSIASLSTIENDKATVDVERLVAICNALGVRPDALLPKGSSTHFHVATRDTLAQEQAASLRIVDHAKGSLTPYHNLLRPLAAPFVGKHFEPFQIEIRSVAEDDLRFISHHHEEFFFVLRGEVECLIKTPGGLVQEVLGPGDCIYFWSFLPHCLRSTTHDPATSVHVMCAAHGSTDSERSDGPTSDIVYFQDMSARTMTQQIAHKITAVRQARGLSLADFARDLEIGARQLSELERGRKPVSIQLLIRLCRRFRKPLEYFLAGTTTVDRPYHSMIRAKDIPDLPSRARRASVAGFGFDNEFRALAHEFPKRGMHPFYVRVTGQPEVDVPLHEHHGQEFVFVLNGEVTLVTVQDGEEVRQHLAAGDSCFIDSAVPHRFVGTGFSPYNLPHTELIDVFWTGLGEDYLFFGPEAATRPNGA